MLHNGFARLTTGLILFVLSILLAACVLPAEALIQDPETLFQTSTLSALQAGDMEGDMTLGALKHFGDFGLGTFNALDGEMVMLDGQIYQVKDDGVASLAEDAIQTPFAAVTFFAADQTFALNDIATCAEMQAAIDGLLPTVHAPYAVKVTGTLTTLQVRAPHRESPPYPTLADALADQAIFDYQNVSGTMVGLRLPDYMAGVNAAGHHFHYISEDRQTGGHVLDCQPGALSVEIDAIAGYRVVGIDAATLPAE
jgi:acetolactate decarboxylase